MDKARSVVLTQSRYEPALTCTDMSMPITASSSIPEETTEHKQLMRMCTWIGIMFSRSLLLPSLRPRLVQSV